MTKLLIRLMFVMIAGVLLVAGGYYVWQQIPQRELNLPLAEVKRGDLVIKTYLRGELRAVRSLTLIAPNIGTQSQITQLALTGALAKRGDLIFELDDSERVAALEDSLLSVEQIEENFKKATAELEIRKSQDEVEIVKADFQVRRAELEVSRNELLGEIDARKNILTLEETKRRKQKLEEDIKNRLQQREAELAVLSEQLNKAQIDVDRDRRRIAQSRVLAPMTGLVSILQNRSGGRGGFGQSTPEIREGDQIPAGMSVAQLLDLSEMELMTKVEEAERANLQEGQQVLIRLDALPQTMTPGTIKQLGNMASTNIFAGEAIKKFECVISIDMRTLLGHIGADSARIARIIATAEQNARFGLTGNARSGADAASLREDSRQGGNRQQGTQQQAGADAGSDGNTGRQPQQARRQGNVQGADPQQSGNNPGAGQGRGGGQGGGGGFDASRMLSRLPAEARNKAEALLKDRSPQDLSEEERQQFRQIMQSSFSGGGGRGQGGVPGGRGQGGVPGGGGQGAGPGSDTSSGGRGLSGGAPSGFSFGDDGGNSISSTSSSGSEFTATERAVATLPLPPQEGSDVEVLLRPGLLADAEVIIESISDTLYIPYQAVFEEGTQTIVYVKEGNRLQLRRVTLGKRTEAQVAILEGLEEGEFVSLSSPDSVPAGTTKKSAPSSGPAFPGGA